MVASNVRVVISLFRWDDNIFFVCRRSGKIPGLVVEGAMCIVSIKTEETQTQRGEVMGIVIGIVGVASLAVVALGILSIIVLGICNRWLPQWACERMGWHLAPTSQGFDGCSFNGTCPRCGKEVLQDSQGNWF